MQFQVPQFIDVENKIIGPLTIKQFLYVAAGFLIIVFSFSVLKFFVWIISSLIVGGVVLSFAFIKHNGRSFSVLIRSMFFYFWRPRKYQYKKTNERLSSAMNNSDIEDLNLKLNTSKGIRSLIRKLRPNTEQQYQILQKATGERDIARKVDYR